MPTARGCDNNGGGEREYKHQMERNYMTIYTRIKDTVTALDAAQMYGLNVRSNGMTNCPFHEDHNPSLKLDRRFYCFGCHAHGDVIDFVSRLFGMCDASTQIICTVHTNVPEKYGRMYGTDKTGYHRCLSKIKQKLEK